MPSILVVDDEQSDRELIRHILQLELYALLEASNYFQATAIFEQQAGQIDLLVTDVALPEQNGCELAKRLLTLYTDLKILFISGSTGAEICKQYGVPITATHFLSKPLLSDELANRV